MVSRHGDEEGFRSLSGLAVYQWPINGAKIRLYVEAQRRWNDWLRQENVYTTHNMHGQDWRWGTGRKTLLISSLKDNIDIESTGHTALSHNGQEIS